MLVDPDKHPSFCKLLFKQGFVDKILMPPVFIKENKKLLAKTCLLKTNVVGMSWEAKIVREKSNYFICEGDWPRFVMHHKLELGDILIFFLIDKSTFQVLPYNQKCFKNSCGRGVFQELSSSSEEEHDVGIARKLKKIKIEPNESSEEEAEGGNEKNDLKKTRFSVMNINDKDPYYEMVVRKTHSFFMTIPKSFAIRTGITNMKKMRLVNEKGNNWKLVDIVHTGPRVYIKRGWAEFRTINKIANGQMCRFKLIQRYGCGYNILQVQKIPKSKCLK
ncbi:B3 domain-containing protein REM9-like isoform X2 [Solanum dulcamara]|uniref:B3 domain-containing protein REM9-like isoform X2 n=1 Tax=Solanum dulcamara TaxID=45834 RepID=UPI0024860A4F|nr:B3 domain-containing protein REM9-like isoform X2 [Solanum dulcamara]